MIDWLNVKKFLENDKHATCKHVVRKANTYDVDADLMAEEDFDEEESLAKAQKGQKSFLDIEDSMAIVLAAAYLIKSKKAKQFLADFFDNGNTLDKSQLLDSVGKAAGVMNDIFSVREEKVADLLRKAINKGGSVVGASVLDRVPSKVLIEEGILNSTKYYTNNYFNTYVVPKIYKSIDGLFATGSVDTAADFAEIRAAIDGHFQSVPYWRVVANAASSRGYHYGVFKAGSLSGRRGYEIVAVLDEKTSDICLELDGKQFWLSDVVDLMEKVAKGDPEDAKVLTPWVTTEQVKGMDDADLAAEGILMPPFHANCRSTIRLI